MVTIRSVNDLTLSLIDFFQTALPDLDTKGGTVARDLFIDAPASQIALLYDALSGISNLQSLRLVAGSDLDKLAQNLGLTRKPATGSTGVALFTFSSIPATIGINKGDIVTAQDGSTFSVINGLSISVSQSNFYRSLAIKYQNDLSFLNITDQFAAEVSVQATTTGSATNISKYSLVRVSTPGVSNVTNVFSFVGGADQEDDATFRNRVLAIFSGSNIGTALGYKNLALSNTFVQDALVIGPGDPLMTRDGTIVKTNPDGTTTIVSEGTGGKVDIIILGSNLTQNTDTFIYLDQSNKNDPTDPSNIVVLGQIPGDAGKTITQRRLDDIASGILPAQPVDSILSVTGSLSGGNFVAKTVDSLGRVSGNYELIKDTGFFGGSPWGSDKFHWVSNQISLFPEDMIKSRFNGQDPTTFTDVLQIPTIQQNISISNENSLVSSTDRSIVQLLHTPAINVTRVFNTNTGERYTVINQNLDNTGTNNTTGRIQISGNTLPSLSDILQVDYTWVIDYDGFSDYDGKILKNNPRSITDSIDWGISNAIRDERVLFSLNSNNTFYTGTTKHPVSSVVSANSFSQTFGTVSVSNIPNFINRLAINLPAVDSPVASIESIKLVNTEEEIFNTAAGDGAFISNRIVVNLQIKYSINIILPSDTPAVNGSYTSIVYNQTDLFNLVNSTGSFTNNQITIPVGNVIGSPATINLDTTYIAALPDLLSCGITNLPLSRSGSGFLTNSNTGPLNAIKSNNIKRENQTIQKNAANEFFVTLSISSSDFSLLASQIITVIDLTTSLELWNKDFPGTITTDVNGNYQLIFSGFNSPNAGENVFIAYFANDLSRNQPFTFSNQIIKYDLQTLQFNFTTNQFFIPINNLTAESNLIFNVIDATTNISVGSGSDGVFSAISTNGSSATLTSSSFNFANVDDLLGKIITISHPVNINNNGSYNIKSIINNNTIIIEVSTENLNNNQISIIRLADDKDIWNATTGQIDLINNQLLLSSTTVASQGDKVVSFLFTNKNLHQSPTRISITVTDQITNTGIITNVGTTITKISNIVFTAINNGLKQNVLEAIKTFLQTNSNTIIPTNSYVARILQVSKVLTTTGNEILSTVANYDVIGSSLNNNLLYANEILFDSSLSNTEFILPSTINNTANAPIIGDKLNISFYYATDNDSENVYFTRNGTLYTNKKFALIDQTYISSGFNASKSARFTFSYFTQPATGSRYKSFYNYLAPKQNERILIQSNFNREIDDTTLTVEASRPLNADVLVRAAKQLLVDATMNIVVKSDFSSSAQIVLQNTKDRLTTTINSNILGTEISSSNLIAAAQSVDGVERARILAFNVDGSVGMVLTIQAQNDQYLVANDIIVNQESL
jgi:Baseplate J-like protein